MFIGKIGYRCRTFADNAIGVGILGLIATPIVYPAMLISRIFKENFWAWYSLFAFSTYTLIELAMYAFELQHNFIAISGFIANAMFPALVWIIGSIKFPKTSIEHLMAATGLSIVLFLLMTFHFSQKNSNLFSFIFSMY